VKKVPDVVSLYLNPPDKAVGLCLDEKTQVQALERTQPLSLTPWGCRIGRTMGASGAETIALRVMVVHSTTWRSCL
jgi:hypothetical protein